MKQTFKCLFLMSVLVFSTQSCIDKDYDNIEKGGVIPIPPLQLSVATINLGELENIVPGKINLPAGAVAVSDTINGLFAGDAVKDFFYEGAERVEVGFVINNTTGETKVSLQNVKIDIYFNVLDETEDKNTIVSLPTQTLRLNGDGKFIDKSGKLLALVDFKALFAAKDMTKMQGANDLEIIVVASADDEAQVHFGPDDKIVFKSAVMKTSGMYFEF